MSRSATLSPLERREARAFAVRVHELLQQLAILIRNTHFHDLSNEVFREPMERFFETLQPLVEEEGSLQLVRVDQDLFANGDRVRMSLGGVHAYKLIVEELRQKRLGGIRFERAADPAAMRRFLALFVELRSDSEEAPSMLNERLSEQGVVGISALDERQPGTGGSGTESADLRERAIRTYQEALEFIRQSVTELETPAQLNQRRAKRLIHKLVDLSYEEGEGFSLFGLASIKDHDAYTFNHMVNVCVLAIAFGHRLGLPRADLAELGLSALYHDLGKMDIPLEVLNKPGKLTDEEWALMGNHTVYGARALFPLVRQDIRVARRILAVLQHHHGFDGKGYPDLQVVTTQTLNARIIAIVDLYDAMTTKRVYQEDFLPDAAIQRMHELAGSYCDPLLVKAFTNCMGIFPVGATVELMTGELAVVVQPAADPDRIDRPVIRLVTDPGKRRVDPQLVDLGTAGQEARYILCCVDPEVYGINAAHYAV